MLASKPVATTPTGKRGGRSIAISEFVTRYGVVIAWLLVIGVFSALKPQTFATWANFQTIFGSQSVLLILTLGLVLSLSVGELDLSIAGVMAVAVVLVGHLNVTHHVPVVPTILIVLLFGLLAGLVNAFFVVVVGVESIVVTLGMGTLLSGIAVAINVETVSGISESLVNAVRGHLLGLPYSFWYAILLTVIVWYLFSLTPLGRRMHFVRVGPQVARLSGVRVDRIRAGALVATSLIASLAGIVQASPLAASSPTVSAAYLLPAFSAAFLGSTTIQPGRFNAWGTFVGVYFLVTGITGLELLGLSGWIENVFYGGSLVLAVALSRLVARYQRRLKIKEGQLGESASKPTADTRAAGETARLPGGEER